MEKPYDPGDNNEEDRTDVSPSTGLEVLERPAPKYLHRQLPRLLSGLGPGATEEAGKKSTTAGNACQWQWVHLEGENGSSTEIHDRFLHAIVLYLCLKVIILVTEGCVQHRISAWPGKRAVWLRRRHIVSGLYFGLHLGFPSPTLGNASSRSAPRLIGSSPVLTLEPRSFC